MLLLYMRCAACPRPRTIISGRFNNKRHAKPCFHVRLLQGHFQVMFSRTHCPLLQKRLSLFMKVRISSGGNVALTSACVCCMLHLA